MEAAGSLPSSSTSSAATRKEWRAVSGNHRHHRSDRNSADEVLWFGAFESELALEDSRVSKLGHSDERTIYEVQQGREPADVDFCSIIVNGGSENDIMHHRLHSVAREREELQQLEIELKAQIIARSEIIEMQKSFDVQLKEHASLAAKLQEQIQEKEQIIRDLERKVEDRQRELHAIKLDNEAAWAKDSLLREQDKELASFRRDRDHSEAERAQLIKQIHDLQEHFQDKERQVIDLQDQNRVAQDTILFKDDQLREAHNWIAQHQQVELLKSHELQERAEQCNQLWLNCQRQFAELERLNFQMQKLKSDMADAGEKSGASANDSQTSQSNSKEASELGQNNGNQVDSNAGDTTESIGGHANGNSGNASSYTSAASVPNQNDHVPRIPLASSSILGMHPYIPPGQMAALHPFVMHQGVSQTGALQFPQSNVSQFHSMPAHFSLHNWQDQQSVSEVSQGLMPNQLPQFPADQNQAPSEVKYNNEMPVNGQAFHSDFLYARVNQITGNDPEKLLSTGEPQVHESIDRSYLPSSQPETGLQQFSSQFNDALTLDSLEQTTEMEEQNIPVVNSGLEGQNLMEERPKGVASQSDADNLTQSVTVSASFTSAADAVLPDGFTSSGQINVASSENNSESTLIDERSLLACIVRMIPAGGKIQISSTLPTRLGKMLAPLHWHDYKRKYGKLDDFVASHPELFVIEGDYIQLREGAQKVIAATAAIVRVAAAAALLSPNSSSLPSVAVTPVAQAQRPKKVQFMDSNQFEIDNHSQLSAVQNQHTNGVYFSASGSLSNVNVKILTQPKDAASNGFDTRSGHQSANGAVGNRANITRSSVSSAQNKGSIQGRPQSSYVAIQHDRTSGAGSTSRR